MITATVTQNIIEAKNNIQEVQTTVAQTTVQMQATEYLTYGTTEQGAKIIHDANNPTVSAQRFLDALRDNQYRGYIFEGIYTGFNQLKLPSNIHVESIKGAVTLQVNPNFNLTFIKGQDEVNGAENITLDGLVIDALGTGRTTGSNGLGFNGIRKSKFLQLQIKKSFSHNFAALSLAGTLRTGAMTVTSLSTIVTGVGTLFLSELKDGDRFRINDGSADRFGRVYKVVSDTALLLDIAWGHATATNTFRKLIPNAQNYVYDCDFEGTTNPAGADNCNFGGFFDDSLVEFSRATEARLGYGFGPDHAHNLTIRKCKSWKNDRDGIGAETVAYCNFYDNELVYNSNGCRLLSGSYRNKVTKNKMNFNTFNGGEVTYQTATFGIPYHNQFYQNDAISNGQHGIRIGSSKNASVVNNTCLDNGSRGIVLVGDNSINPDNSLITGNICLDTRPDGEKTQAVGIEVRGDSVQVISNHSRDEDHVNVGILVDVNATNCTVVDSQPGVDPHYHGTIHTDHTQSNGLAFSLYTNRGGDATSALSYLRADNVAFNREVQVVQSDTLNNNVTTQRVIAEQGYASIFETSSTVRPAIFARNYDANGYSAWLEGKVRYDDTPTHPDNTSAISGGLAVGDIYKTSTGELRIRV
jgi:hypothetical protein